MLSVVTLGLSALYFAPATASSFSYEGLQLSYSQTSADDQFAVDGFDVNSIRIEGLYSLNPNIAVGASYISGSGDTRVQLTNGNFATDVDVSGPAAFGFYHDEIKPGTDYLVGGFFSMEESEFSAGGQEMTQLSDDDSSAALLGGIRHLLSPQLEVGTLATYELNADDDEFSFEINARYSFGNNFDLLASFTPDSDADTIAIGIKKYLDF